MTGLCVASCVKDYDSKSLKTLLLRGHSPDEMIDRTSETALHRACSLYVPSCAMLLLAAGAEFHILNDANRTPLEVLVRSKPWDVAMVMRAFASLGVPCEPVIVRVYPHVPTMYYDERKIPVGRTCRELSALRNELIFTRAFEVCTALRNLRISALEMCEILNWACCPSVQDVPFHKIWDIVTLIKHYTK